MNEILDKIMTRRSIRSYTEEQIPDEKLDAILKAAIHAPSGSNSQTWLFTALKNTELLKTLNESVRKCRCRTLPDTQQMEFRNVYILRDIVRI